MRIHRLGMIIGLITSSQTARKSRDENDQRDDGDKEDREDHNRTSKNRCGRWLGHVERKTAQDIL